jgi:hypothetical protein
MKRPSMSHRTLSRHTLALACAVACLSSAAIAAPQRAPANRGGATGTASPALPPPLDQATIDFLLPEAEQARIRGAVQRTMGRELKVVPAVQTVAPAEMREALLRSMSLTSPNREFDPRSVEQLSQRQVALFDIATKGIFVGSGGLAMVGGTERAAVARIMFAHAVATAIVDQEIGLAAYSNTDRPDVMVARRMASEGFIVTARDRAAITLGLDSFAPAVRPHIPGSFDTRDDRSPLERTVYGNGRTVIEAIWNARGVDAVWATLAERPSSVPELGRAIPRSRALRLAQAALDPMLTAPTWTRVRMPAAPLVSLATLKGPSLAERGALASGCLVVDTLGFAGARGGSLLLSSLRGSDAAATERLSAAVARVPELLRNDFERAQVEIRMTQSTAEIQGVTVRTTLFEQVDELGAMAPTRIVELVRGNEVISISLSGVRIEQAILDKAVETVASAIGADPEYAAPNETSEPVGP